MKTKFALCWVAILAVALLGCGTSEAPPAKGFTPSAITLKEVPDTNLKELTDQSLVFVDAAGVKWEAPKGTHTDGASVPRLALMMTDGRFDASFLKAAVVHDAYCQTDNAERCPEQYKKRSWQETHRMFYEACLAGGTPPGKARMMFAGVWLGGPRWDDPDNDLSQVPDEALQEEFAICAEWMERTDPSIDQVEAWMAKHEAKLLGRAD